MYKHSNKSDVQFRKDQVIRPWLFQLEACGSGECCRADNLCYIRNISTANRNHYQVSLCHSIFYTSSD